MFGIRFAYLMIMNYHYLFKMHPPELGRLLNDNRISWRSVQVERWGESCYGAVAWCPEAEGGMPSGHTPERENNELARLTDSKLGGIRSYSCQYAPFSDCSQRCLRGTLGHHHRDPRHLSPTEAEGESNAPFGNWTLARLWDRDRR